LGSSAVCAFQIVVFCTGVAHARALADMLEQQGISAAVVHGDMPDKEREVTLKRFREGPYT
jgi:superfamily II DNA/RNA helicase